MKKNFFLLILLVTLLIPSILPVQAQESSNDVWGEVLNADGSINTSNLQDHGVVTQPADWMPSIPFVGNLEAEYHIYTTPSGNTLSLPTTTTMIFMMLNPSESGLNAADANYGNAVAGLTALLTGAGGFPADGVEASQFADKLISGETSMWSLATGDVFNMLSFLADKSLEDNNLYNLALLYTPSSCFAVPGGCPVDLAAILPPEIDVEEPREFAEVSCPAPVVTPGVISRSGAKSGPNYPIVVGQDPDKTGVNVSFSASVAPTIYTFWTMEPEMECVNGPDSRGRYDCRRGTGHEEQVGWTCEMHTQSYPECISLASGSLRLTQDSKNWILGTLSIRYPEAYIHHPTFTYPATGGCTWSFSTNAQVEDPGTWDIFINGQTSGTPVSAPRPFGGPAGSFDVWLKETAIIQ